MRIGELMSREVEVVQRQASAERAWHRMKEARINHLIVLEGGEVVGVISRKDLAAAGASRRHEKTVGNLMHADVVSANPSTPVRKAAQLMRGRSIGCLPVLNNGRLVGILSMTDLLDLLSTNRVRPESASPWSPTRQKERWPSAARRTRIAAAHTHA